MYALQKSIDYLEKDAEREGEGDDHHEPGDGEEDPATQPNTSVADV